MSPRQALRDRSFLLQAAANAVLATCQRRQTGAIFVNEWHEVVATGYNGVPPEDPHCTDFPCPGVGLASGTGLEKCQAIHAEMNAYGILKDLHSVRTVYCTTAPCIHCVKLIARTSARRIVFLETYPHAREARDEWLRNKVGIRSWDHVPMTKAEVLSLLPACFEE